MGIDVRGYIKYASGVQPHTSIPPSPSKPRAYEAMPAHPDRPVARMTDILEAVATASARLARLERPEEMVKTALGLLRDLLDPAFAVAYLRSNDNVFVRYDLHDPCKLPLALAAAEGESPDALEARVAGILGDAAFRFQALAAQERFIGFLVVGEAYATLPEPEWERQLVRLVAPALTLALERVAMQREAVADFVHELKRPLSNIALPAELCSWDLDAITRGDLSAADALPRIRQRLAFIIGQVRSTRDSIDGLHELRDEDEVIQEPVVLADVVQNCVSALHAELKGSGVAVIEHMQPDVPAVHGSAKQLQVVLMNLLRNAIEAMSKAPTRQLTLRTGVCDGRVEVTVEDTGEGIPEPDRRRIFDRRFSTKRGLQRGLGLSIVQQIVARHRGTLDVQSTAGSGSRFRLAFLPG